MAAKTIHSTIRRTFSTLRNHQTELLYGTHSIEAALTSHSRSFKSLYAVGTKGEDDVENKAQDQAIKRRGRLARLASDANVPIHWISRQELNNLLPPGVSGTSGGVALECSPLNDISFVGDSRDLHLMCDNSPVDNNVVLFLDEMNDPQNLGATLRCACFLGAAGVVISAKNSAPLSPSVSRASAGALEILASQGRLMFTKGALPTLLKDMQKNEWDIVGTVVQDERSVLLNSASKPTKSTDKVAIIMGSEGFGMRKMVKRSCTTLVTLPASIGSHSCSSLNVSVTSALMLHHYL